MVADKTDLSINQWRHSDTDLDARIQTVVWGHVIQDGRQNVNKAQAAAIDVGQLFGNGRVVFEIGQEQSQQYRLTNPQAFLDQT